MGTPESGTYALPQTETGKRLSGNQAAGGIDSGGLSLKEAAAVQRYPENRGYVWLFLRDGGELHDWKKSVLPVHSVPGRFRSFRCASPGRTILPYRSILIPHSNIPDLQSDFSMLFYRKSD